MPRNPEPQLRHRLPPKYQHVLQLDINAVPQAWISLEDAACHIVTDSVAWHDGEEPLATLRGGVSALTGRQSLVEVPPIIALRGASRVNLFDVVPAFSREKCLIRDRHTCCYCGEVFRAADLTIDHIFPASRGGRLEWANACCSCRLCNAAKRDRTPEEAGMPLLFVPYCPSRFESFLLEGRHIRADVHEWLASRLPKGSRLC